MTTGIKIGGNFLFAFLFLSMADQSLAQPPEGIEWPERVLDYANYWWDTNYPDLPWHFNPDYGYRTDLSEDCANFQSQMAQAGCVGLCEYNNNNQVHNPPYDDWTDLADCPYWMADVSGQYWSDGNCMYSTDPWPPPMMHLVVPGAEDLSWWFYYSDDGFPVEDWDVRPNDGELIPEWVGPGTFGFMEWWNSTRHIYVWHSFYVGAGTGNGARAWCHSGDHGGEWLVLSWFSWLGQDLDHWEFYQPGTSPNYSAKAPIIETGGD